MKRKFTHISLLSALLLPQAFLRADWVTIADFDSYQPGWGETELQAEGWIFQDGDYNGFTECTDGTNDCTGYRAVTEAPYNPSKGSSNALLVRAGDPAESLVSNARTNTAIALPEEIPLGGKATIYFQWAHEITPGHDFFMLTDIAMQNVGPIVEEGDPLPDNYGDFGAIVHVRNNSEFAIHQGGYVPAIVDENDPDADILEREVWYEMWLVVDNQSLQTGDQLGSRFDLYIRGGKFGNDEPFHVVNTVSAYANAGYTSWFFRRNVDEPVRTFNILAQYGNPNDNPRGSGGLWVNSLYMYPGEFVTTAPNEAETWNGYVVGEDGWADTEDWMGFLYVEHDPWIYSEAIGWFYVGSVEAEGGWIYAVN